MWVKKKKLNSDTILLYSLSDGRNAVVVMAVGIVAGVCCGGKLHGRVHQTAGEAEWL